MKDGGSAFPLPLGTMNCSEPGQSGGMSLRDYFAIHAPDCVLDIEGWPAAECAQTLGVDKYTYREHYAALVSKLAYEYADAMLAARSKAGEER